MDYVGRLFRPPSEAESLLLQVSVGCSHNKCTYCAMYDLPEQRFRPKDPDVIEADIIEAAAAVGPGHAIYRVFLTDGDALILPMDRLVQILEQIRQHLPTVRRVGIYGDARSILRKSETDLKDLADLGLGLVYHGVESGDDDVLARVCKGSTSADVQAAAERLRAVGLRHSVMVMLGLGGVQGSRQHAERTAALLSEIDPPFVGALTTTLVPGTPLHIDAEAGRFQLPDPWGMLDELKILVRDSRFSRCRFHANHASNYLPLSLNLPADRDSALAQLDQVLAEKDRRDLRPEHWRGL